MMTIDPAALSICARIVAHFKGDDAPSFNDSAELVSRLYADVVADMAAVSDSWIARHHLFDDIGNCTLHCVYERVGAHWVVNFYLSEQFSAEPEKPIMLEFIGVYANTIDHVN